MDWLAIFSALMFTATFVLWRSSLKHLDTALENLNRADAAWRQSNELLDEAQAHHLKAVEFYGLAKSLAGGNQGANALSVTPSASAASSNSLTSKGVRRT